MYFPFFAYRRRLAEVLNGSLIGVYAWHFELGYVLCRMEKTGWSIKLRLVWNVCMTLCWDVFYVECDVKMKFGWVDSVLHSEIHLLKKANLPFVNMHGSNLPSFMVGWRFLPKQVMVYCIEKKGKCSRLTSPHCLCIVVRRRWKIWPHCTRSNLNFLGYLLVDSSC